MNFDLEADADYFGFSKTGNSPDIYANHSYTTKNALENFAPNAGLQTNYGGIPGYTATDYDDKDRFLEFCRNLNLSYYEIYIHMEAYLSIDTNTEDTNVGHKYKDHFVYNDLRFIGNDDTETLNNIKTYMETAFDCSDTTTIYDVSNAGTDPQTNFHVNPQDYQLYLNTTYPADMTDSAIYGTLSTGGATASLPSTTTRAYFISRKILATHAIILEKLLLINKNKNTSGVDTTLLTEVTDKWKQVNDIFITLEDSIYATATSNAEWISIPTPLSSSARVLNSDCTESVTFSNNRAPVQRRTVESLARVYDIGIKGHPVFYSLSSAGALSVSGNDVSNDTVTGGPIDASTYYKTGMMEVNPIDDTTLQVSLKAYNNSTTSGETIATFEVPYECGDTINFTEVSNVNNIPSFITAPTSDKITGPQMIPFDIANLSIDTTTNELVQPLTPFGSFWFLAFVPFGTAKDIFTIGSDTLTLDYQDDGSSNVDSQSSLPNNTRYEKKAGQVTKTVEEGINDLVYIEVYPRYTNSNSNSNGNPYTLRVSVTALNKGQNIKTVIEEVYEIPYTPENKITFKSGVLTAWDYTDRLENYFEDYKNYDEMDDFSSNVFTVTPLAHRLLHVPYLAEDTSAKGTETSNLLNLEDRGSLLGRQEFALSGADDSASVYLLMYSLGSLYKYSARGLPLFGLKDSALSPHQPNPNLPNYNVNMEYYLNLDTFIVYEGSATAGSAVVNNDNGNQANIATILQNTEMSTPVFIEFVAFNNGAMRVNITVVGKYSDVDNYVVSNFVPFVHNVTFLTDIQTNIGSGYKYANITSQELSELTLISGNTTELYENMSDRLSLYTDANSNIEKYLVNQIVASDNASATLGPNAASDKNFPFREVNAEFNGAPTDYPSAAVKFLKNGDIGSYAQRMANNMITYLTDYSGELYILGDVVNPITSQVSTLKSSFDTIITAFRMDHNVITENVEYPIATFDKYSITGTLYTDVIPMARFKLYYNNGGITTELASLERDVETTAASSVNKRFYASLTVIPELKQGINASSFIFTVGRLELITPSNIATNYTGSTIPVSPVTLTPISQLNYSNIYYTNNQFILPYEIDNIDSSGEPNIYYHVTHARLLVDNLPITLLREPLLLLRQNSGLFEPSPLPAPVTSNTSNLFNISDGTIDGKQAIALTATTANPSTYVIFSTLAFVERLSIMNVPLFGLKDQNLSPHQPNSNLPNYNVNMEYYLDTSTMILHERSILGNHAYHETNGQDPVLLDTLKSKYGHTVPVTIEFAAFDNSTMRVNITVHRLDLGPNNFVVGHLVPFVDNVTFITDVRSDISTNLQETAEEGQFPVFSSLTLQSPAGSPPITGTDRADLYTNFATNLEKYVINEANFTSTPGYNGPSTGLNPFTLYNNLTTTDIPTILTEAGGSKIWASRMFKEQVIYVERNLDTSTTRIIDFDDNTFDATTEAAYMSLFDSVLFILKCHRIGNLAVGAEHTFVSLNALKVKVHRITTTTCVIRVTDNAANIIAEVPAFDYTNENVVGICITTIPDMPRHDNTSIDSPALVLTVVGDNTVNTNNFSSDVTDIYHSDSTLISGLTWSTVNVSTTLNAPLGTKAEFISSSFDLGGTSVPVSDNLLYKFIQQPVEALPFTLIRNSAILVKLEAP